ncbi:MAG: phosphopantothenoylcysteine decarboxylase [Thermomicrobiales bacterium]
MGYAIVQSLIDRGAQVILISGSVAVPAPFGAEVIPVESAVQMDAAVQQSVQDADALIMTAAVSDYRPLRQSSVKLKKDEIGETLTIEFVTNPDIVAGVQNESLIKIGFAAETNDLLRNARRKLAAKSLDMIVANDAEATIGSLTSEATFLYPDGVSEAMPMMSKTELAEEVADRLVALIARPGRAKQ